MRMGLKLLDWWSEHEGVGAEGSSDSVTGGGTGTRGGLGVYLIGQDWMSPFWAAAYSSL